MVSPSEKITGWVHRERLSSLGQKSTLARTRELPPRECDGNAASESLQEPKIWGRMSPKGAAGPLGTVPDRKNKFPIGNQANQ